MKDLSDILYFDYAATTPCAAEVAEAIHGSLTDGVLFANASSAHGLAYSAAQAIEQARGFVGTLVNGNSSNVLFTSGATESNNLALLGLSNYLKKSNKTHIISSSTEHKAVLDTLKHLAKFGHSVTLLDPDQHGIIATAKIERAVTPETGLISIMHVNNETGVIQNIEAIGKIAKQAGAVFHVDAAQSAGKLPIDVQVMNISLLSMTAHKFYGPKGSGALYIDSALQQSLTPLLHGGGQEKSIRPGTYSNHQIIGLGKTIELALEQMQADSAHAQSIRDIFLTELRDIIARVNGSETHNLPNILNIGIKDVDATTLLTCLQDKVALATGSACDSGIVSASPVLVAMGLTGEALSNAIRISFGRYTTVDQAMQACALIKAEVKRIRQTSDRPEGH